MERDDKWKASKKEIPLTKVSDKKSPTNKRRLEAKTDSFVIGPPENFTKGVHVDKYLQWTNADPLQAFSLQTKLGEGYHDWDHFQFVRIRLQSHSQSLMIQIELSANQYRSSREDSQDSGHRSFVRSGNPQRRSGYSHRMSKRLHRQLHGMHLPRTIPLDDARLLWSRFGQRLSKRSRSILQRETHRLYPQKYLAWSTISPFEEYRTQRHQRKQHLAE